MKIQLHTNCTCVYNYIHTIIFMLKKGFEMESIVLFTNFEFKIMKIITKKVIKYTNLK